MPLGRQQVSHINTIRTVLGLATVLVAVPAYASISWTFNSGNCVTGECSSTGYGNTKSFQGSDGLTDVVVSAWSNSGTGGGLQSSQLELYSGGLGVTNRGESGSSPNHATDNAGYTDSILFDFGGNAVTLDSLQIGWGSYYDTDVTVLAYNGSAAPDSFSGQSYADLISNGWAHVGDYYDVYDSAGHTATINADPGTTYTSSYWLISAFNTDISQETCCGGNDYFKVYALGGTTERPPQVSAPGSLALLLLGIPLLRVSRGRFRA